MLEKVFASRQTYEVEGNDLLQGLVKLIMNSLYEVQIRIDINESYKCKSWMKTEYDEIVLDYWKLPNGSNIVKMKIDDGLDGDDCDVKKNLPSDFGRFFSK